jgi:hypothetical protein
MFASIFSRSTVARLAIAGMVLAAVTVSGPTASADSGPVNAQSYSYTRDANGNALTIRAGEEGQVISNAFLSDEYSGWPVANNTVFTRTAFQLRNVPAPLVPEYYPLEVSRSWSGSNWSDDECEGVDDYENTLTITSTSNCINNLSVRDSYYLENDTAGDLVVNTNFSSQVLKAGKKGKRATTITTSNGLTNSLFGNFSVYNEASVTMTAEDKNLYPYFEMCIDESLVETGDVLDIDYELSHQVGVGSATPVSTTRFAVEEGDGWEYGTWDVTDESSVTFEITDAPEENLKLSFGLDMSDDVNSDDTTEAGTYAGTVDVKLAGSSVLEPCPTYDADWPTLSTTDGEAGSTNATTSASLNLPTSFSVENDNFEQYSSAPDGFGGMFYWGYPGATYQDNPNSEVNVVHMNGDTPSNQLAGIGSVMINTGKYGFFEIGRFGEGGGSWFALVPGNKGAYSFKSGSMSTTAGQVTASFTSKTLNGLCGRGFSAEYVSPVSAATVSPLLNVSCANGAISKSVLAKVVSNRVSVVATLGTGSRSRPCVVTSLGTDSRASGTQAAVVVYTRVSSKDAAGYCIGEGATVSSRSITTVTAALTATQARVTSNPWTGRDDEPDFIDIAAGSVSGTWFGVSHEMIEPGYSPSVPAQLFTMTATAITIESNDITIADSTSFGDWALVTPLNQESPTQWSLMITGSTEFDSEGIGLATVATINPETGVITNGDVLEMRGMGSLSSRIIASFSAESGENATMYTVTDADTYKTTVWEYPVG